MDCRRLAVCLRATLILVLVAGHAATSDPESGELWIGPVGWQGYPVGLRRPHDPTHFQLAPDGTGFLYQQGPPLERLMLQPVQAADAQPLMLGTERPLAWRPAGFSPDGRHVYFTVRESPPALRSGSARSLRSYVARVALPSLEFECLYPRVEAVAGTSAIYLEVHPSEEAILIGTCRDPEEGDRAPDRTLLEVAELRPGAAGSSWKRDPLGFRAAADAIVRYAEDGRSVEYSVTARDESFTLTTLYSIDLETRAQRRIEADVAGSEGEDLPRRAGEMEVLSRLRPHLGSFGWDGFRAHLVRRVGGPRAAWARLVIPSELLSRIPAPLTPVSFRGESALLCGGPEDRPLPVVAHYMEERGDSPGGARAP